MVDATRCFFVFFLGCTVASRGGYQMARGRHYAKLSLSNAARLSFSDLCILLFMFLSLCRLCVCVFLCSHWSLVDVPLIFFCPADHVPDWQPRVLLGMVEARSVNVKKTTTTTYILPCVMVYYIISVLILLFFWCPCMAINVSVPYHGGLLSDIILLTQCYFHRGTCLNAMKRFCICSL